MKFYFQISLIRFRRKLEEGGFHFYLALFLLLFLFCSVSFLLFAKFESAPWIYFFSCIFFQVTLSEYQRTEFLKNCFPKSTYFRIRILENSLIVLPFFGYLLLELAFLEAFLLLLTPFLLVFIRFKKQHRVLIPSFFFTQELEFLMGLRTHFYFLIFSYLLAFIALYVGNPNLGIFALLSVYFIVFTFYSKPEEPYFVWIFAQTPKQFLLHKIKFSVWYALLLALPIFLSLLLFFLESLFFILLFFFLVQLVLSLVILAKYSSFPAKNSISESIILGLSILFPVLLIATIPYFYSKSIQQLETFLTHD